MRIFVYEFITAGGMYHLASAGISADALLSEGRAMLAAACDDFVQVPGLEVCVMWDHRLPPLDAPRIDVASVTSASDEERTFDRLSAQSDRILLIAPEFDGWLLKRTRQVLESGTTLLGPSADLVRLTTDKCATASLLRDAQVPSPITHRCADGADLPHDMGWPAVVKPIDGAGSLGVRLLTQSQARQVLNGSRPYCVQAWCEGRAASVSAICGPQQTAVLPPCWQYVQRRSFAYLGGGRIADAPLVDRAVRLARRTLDALPDTRGYIGIDLVLGSAGDGSDTVVI